MKLRARDRYFSNILQLHGGFFDEHHSAELNSHFGYLDGINYLAGRQLPRILRAGLSLVTVSISMAFGNLRIAVVAGLLFGIQVFIIKYLDRSIQIHALLCKKVENSMNRFREESFLHITTVKNFGCERERAQQFHECLQEDQKGRTQLVRLRAIRSGVVKLFYAIAAPIIIYIGIDQASR